MFNIDCRNENNGPDTALILEEGKGGEEEREGGEEEKEGKREREGEGRGRLLQSI